MPVYNAERHLSESIKSILNQSFSEFEFLIINDGSSDGSREIIKSFNDSRIVLHDNNRNFGLTKSLNIGLNLAKGRYIARMDADDISYQNRLEKQYQFMENNPDIGFCGTWYKKIGDSSKILKTPINPEKIKMRSFID